MVKHGITLTNYKLTFFNIKFSVLKNKELRGVYFHSLEDSTKRSTY
jgi:hypothetical protein